jgi:hypothetical protein
MRQFAIQSGFADFGVENSSKWQNCHLSTELGM